MGYCFLENVNASKASDGRVFVVMFVNKNGAPVYVDIVLKPYVSLSRHRFTKIWNNFYDEPSHVVMLGSVYETWARKAVRELTEMLTLAGGKIQPKNVTVDSYDVKAGLCRMEPTKKQSVLNRWRSINKIKTPPVKKNTPHIPTITRETLMQVLEPLAENMSVEEFSLIKQIIKTYDPLQKTANIVFMPHVSKGLTPQQIKKLIPKIRWFFVLKGEYKTYYNNVFTVAKPVQRKASMLYQT